MGCNNNFKTLPTTKAGFQCLQYGHLKMYTEVKITCQSLVNPWESMQWKQLTLKRRTWYHWQTISRNWMKKNRICYICKKKSLTNNTLMIKIITKIKTIVIILVSIKVLHIVLAIWNIEYLKRFVWFFTMAQTLTVTLS